MQRAVEACGYGGKIAFALDCASSEMYDAKSNTYFLGGRRVSAMSFWIMPSALPRAFIRIH